MERSVNSFGGFSIFARIAASTAGIPRRRAVTDFSRSTGGEKFRFIRRSTAFPASPAYPIGFVFHDRITSRSCSSERIAPSIIAPSIESSTLSFPRRNESSRASCIFSVAIRVLLGRRREIFEFGIVLMKSCRRALRWRKSVKRIEITVRKRRAVRRNRNASSYNSVGYKASPSAEASL